MNPFGTKPDFRPGSSRLGDALNASFLQAVKDAVEQISRTNTGSWDVHGFNMPEHEPTTPQIYVRIISSTFNYTTGSTEYQWQKITPQDTQETGMVFKDSQEISSEIDGTLPIVSMNPDIPIDGSVIVAIREGQQGPHLFSDYPQRHFILVEVTDVSGGRIAWREMQHQGEDVFLVKTGGMTGSTSVNYAIEPNGAAVSVGDRGYIRRGYCPGGVRVRTELLVAAVESTSTVAQQIIYVENVAGGTFTLTLDGQTTAAISYDANASEIETRLNELAYAPSVTVYGDNPFTVVFGDYREWGPIEADITNLRSQQLWIYTTSGFAELEAAPQMIWMEVTGRSGSHYAWKEKEQLSNGSMTDTPSGRTGTTTVNFAKEVNSRTDISNGTIVLGKPGFGWNPRVEIEATQEGGGLLHEIQSVKVLDADGGTYTLAYSENTTPPSYTATSALAYNANSSTVQTALRSITGMSDLTVTGNATEADPFLVTFGGFDDQLLLVANQSALTGAELWTFEYTVPSSSNSTTIPELTVTTSLLSENSTTLNGTLTINGSGSQNHFYNGTYTFNQYGGNVSYTYGSNTSLNFNTTLGVTLNANTTITLIGSIFLTITGNIVIDSSKTITLPKIVGNMAGSILQAIPSSGSTAGGPGRFQFLNGAVEVTRLTGTPTTPSAGTMGLFVKDSDGLLYKIDSSGTQTPVANTGSGTSAGGQYSVQIADSVSGDFDYEDSGGGYIFEYNKSTHRLSVSSIKVVDLNAHSLSTIVADGTGLLSTDASGALPYSAGTPSDWQTSAPTTLKAAIDRLAAAVVTLLGGQIP